MIPRITLVLALLQLFLSNWQSLLAEEANDTKPLASKFVRLQRDSDEQLTAMQTAIVSFSKPGEKGGVTIDLIGAVHVGEKSYYDQLNQAFRKYDVVLFELVAPAGTRVPKARKASNNHIAGVLQNGIKDVLELDHQLEMIDYRQRNMLHADMSPDEFAKSMNDRGESFMTIMLKFMAHSLAEESRMQAKETNFDVNLLAALFDKNRAIVMKRLLAEQFESLESTMEVLSGKEGSTIITERNQIALKMLKEELQAGRRHIAIFYGAGHMPHMEQQLVANFGLQRTGEQWLTAWNLTLPKPAPAGK